MHELFRRLFRSRPLAAQILVASFFVNLLFLASPIFVIQILSRYVGYGFDGTLYTLTAGMLIALVLGLAFSMIRTRMCATVSAEPDRVLQAAVLDSLARVRTAAIERIPQARIQEVMAGPQVVQSAYEASHIAAVLDMPFFLLFLVAITALSPWLGLITLLAAAATVVAGRMNMTRTRTTDAALREELIRHRGGVHSAIQGAETVRAFHAAGYLNALWTGQMERLTALKDRALRQKSWGLSIVQGLSSLLRVMIYAVGAKLVVSGDLTVGSLIGISILSAKALQISTSFMQSVQLMGKADDAMRMIAEFMGLPRETGGGTAIKRFTGRLEFKDLSFAFPGATGPLFESLNHVVEPGTVVGVFGANGAGKTTLSRIVAGLIEPSRGQILADGVDLRQLAPEWWRRQVMYLPQEPAFLNGTYRENLTLLDPDIDDARLNEIIRRADLRRFLDATATGLDTPVTEGGRSLPLGVRKRLAIARALVSQGRLAVFDEPTEGLDAEGCDAVFKILNGLASDGVTLIIVSRDPSIVKGYGTIIDLNSKPVPRIVQAQKQAPGPATRP